MFTDPAMRLGVVNAMQDGKIVLAPHQYAHTIVAAMVFAPMSISASVTKALKHLSVCTKRALLIIVDTYAINTACAMQGNVFVNRAGMDPRVKAMNALPLKTRTVLCAIVVGMATAATMAMDDASATKATLGIHAIKLNAQRIAMKMVTVHQEQVVKGYIVYARKVGRV